MLSKLIIQAIYYQLKYSFTIKLQNILNKVNVVLVVVYNLFQIECKNFFKTIYGFKDHYLNPF